MEIDVDVLVDWVRQFQRLITKQRRTNYGFQLLLVLNAILVLMTAPQLITFPTVVYFGSVMVGWWLMIRLGQLTRQISEFKVITGELTDQKQQSVIWYLEKARECFIRSYRRVRLSDCIAIMSSTLCGLAFTWHHKGIGAGAALLLIPVLFLWLPQLGEEKTGNRLMAECRQHLGLVRQLMIDVLAEHPGLVGPASISRIGPDVIVTAERGLSTTESVFVPNG